MLAQDSELSVGMKFTVRIDFTNLADNFLPINLYSAEKRTCLKKLVHA